MTDASALASVLPAYEIGGELGRGGFGIVVAGRHRQLGRLVAIKELPPQLAADAGVRARFVTEARVLASLDHPHIVPVYDYVEQDGLCLLVMESLPGGTVWEAFQQNGYTPHTACAVVMVSCAGLHYAHEHGVLHRDVKPENLLFTQSGQLKVADFGIAKVVGGKDALATTAGEILGTPAYMAPEQAEGKDLGPASDIYAAGVMLYELLSGVLPFSEEGGGIAIVYRHVFEQPRPLREVAPAVPAGLADVVMRALARDPADRYATAEDFGVAIGQAATAAFGPGWLASTAVPVLAGGRILSSTVSAAPMPTPTPTPPVADGRETVVVRRDPPPAVPAQRVRPSAVLRVKSDFGDLSPESLIPVRQVLAVPAWPVAFALVTLALVGLVALLAVVGVASPDRTPTVARGTVTLAGVDVASGGAVSVDLGDKLPVRVTKLPAAASGATEVALRLGVAKVPLLGSSTAPLLRKGGPGIGAEIDARGNRFLAAGIVSGELVFAKNGAELMRTPVALDVRRSFYTTVPGVLAGLALLFLLAYAESLVSPLRRRGRRRISSTLGLGVVGALLGVLAVVICWLLKVTEPTATTAVICAGVGALAGLALAVTATQAGRRARVLRVARKQEFARVAA